MFEEIKTQEEFDARISERLKREREKISKEFADYDELKAKAEKVETLSNTLEVERADFAKQIADLKATHEAEAKAWEVERAKNKVSREFGLPMELAERLKGENEEALRKDAETLSQLIKSKNVPPLASKEGTEGADKGDTALLNTIRELKSNN